MIARLHGILLEKSPPFLIVDVQGVGYELEASMNTFFRLPETGNPVQLFTHFVVREDAQLLYGFSDQPEQLLFRALIKANGVGPKLALAILSAMTGDELITCLHQENASALTRIPGVGKKTAERLIIELRDRVKNLYPSQTLERPSDDLSAGLLTSSHTHREEAESALIALGYKPAQASKAVAQAEQALTGEISSEALIRSALRTMVAG